jgi:DNA mismatch endonuclease (patch repair protein)
MPADVVTPEVRSRMMAGIKGKDTKPELVIRSALHRAGFRFRLHYKNMPGRPDLVFPRYRAVVFVHGCFWHGHDCHLFRWPSTREEFWREKIGRNVARDSQQTSTLLDTGWRVAVC